MLLYPGINDVRFPSSGVLSTLVPLDRTIGRSEAKGRASHSRKNEG